MWHIPKNFQEISREILELVDLRSYPKSNDPTRIQVVSVNGTFCATSKHSRV